MNRSLVLLLSVSFALLGVACLLVQGPSRNLVREPSTMPAATTTSPLDMTVTALDGSPLDLRSFRGKVVLIVNVASRCGLTPQYRQLQTLHERYAERGLVVLGVPSNDFGGQEPGSSEQIREFCSVNYGVTFPMLAKVSVKGGDKHPLYRFLTEPATAGEFAGDIEWNFAKFLVDRSGQLMARFNSRTSPTDVAVITAIESALAAQ